ncbi:hypothetical protein ACEWY4_016484 [Coilia grayii]|uniref:NAD(P)(+)--arginine ADP-ribosyltransferase n=1 Tax=Coilia grayii TaxID=363190 RepID=A0ABD1JKH6_9TELE
MAPNSVDDDYQGCSANMLHSVVERYLPEEKSKNQSFEKAWAKAENATQGLSPQLDNLTKNHAIALRAYSFDTPNVHAPFNKAVHEGKKVYKTSFMYHSLHFLLTDAIQHLNAKGDCLQTYRGTFEEFKPPLGFRNRDIMRFGSFTSTSLSLEEAVEFGNKSCFEVHTCHGANMSKYSEYQYEQEVLIPPYEKFVITKVIRGQTKPTKMKCNVVYQLKSAGKVSNLRCALFKKGSGVF